MTRMPQERMSPYFAVFNLHVNDAGGRADAEFIAQWGQERWEQEIKPYHDAGIMSLFRDDPLAKPWTLVWIALVTAFVNENRSAETGTLLASAWSPDEWPWPDAYLAHVTHLEEWNEDWEHEWLTPSVFQSGSDEVTVVHPLRERDGVVTVLAAYSPSGLRRSLYVKGSGWDETNYWGPHDPEPEPQRSAVYTREKVEEDVRYELDEMFVRLANRWGLRSGDESPEMVFRWEEHTVPHIVDFAWSLYWGNQVPYVVIDTPELPGSLDTNRRAAFRVSARSQSPAGLDVTQEFEDGGEPVWRAAREMEPNDSPELQEKIRDLLGAI